MSGASARCVGVPLLPRSPRENSAPSPGRPCDSKKPRHLTSHLAGLPDSEELWSKLTNTNVRHVGCGSGSKMVLRSSKRRTSSPSLKVTMTTRATASPSAATTTGRWMPNLSRLAQTTAGSQAPALMTDNQGRRPFFSSPTANSSCPKRQPITSPPRLSTGA